MQINTVNERRTTWIAATVAVSTFFSQQLPLDQRQSIIFLPYPQKLVNNILVSIIISCAQGIAKSLEESFGIRHKLNHNLNLLKLTRILNKVYKNL